ncbi:MAG TPA: hypothetical protein VF601_03205 [Beijerinckiaceae bacterium]
MQTETGRWQPIDTAPEDRDVLIYVPAWGPLIARFNAEFGEWTSRMQCPVSLAEETDRPTHWMALPEPPADAATDLAGHDRLLAPHAASSPSAAAGPELKTGH